MNEQRIREIANESSYHAENSVDYYSGIVDGLTWEAKILKARDLKFSELIVKECVRYFNEDYQRDFNTLWREDLSKGMREHFGINE
jgi:hypothetical protein